MEMMMNKPKNVIAKLNRIEELISLINNKLDYELGFNNVITNNYKITTKNKEFVFKTYPEVINALELICELNLILY